MKRSVKLVVALAMLSMSLPAATLAMPGKGKGQGPSHGGGKNKANQERASKVTLCHLPPGNPDNYKTLSVGAGALDAHLGHGDVEGQCDEETLARVRHRSRRLSGLDHDRVAALERARRERDEALERARDEAERAGRSLDDAVRDRIRRLFGVAERKVLREYDEGRVHVLGGAEDAQALTEAAESARAVADDI